jgi:hypothetical protein
MADDQWLSAQKAIEIIRRRIDTSIGRAEAILQRARTSGEVRTEPWLLLNDDGVVGMGVRPGNPNAKRGQPGMSEADLLDWLDREAPEAAKQKTAKPERRRTQALRDRAAEAVVELWPSGVPDQAKLSNKLFGGAVNDWLKADCKKRGIPYAELKRDTLSRARKAKPKE